MQTEKMATGRRGRVSFIEILSYILLGQHTRVLKINWSEQEVSLTQGSVLNMVVTLPFCVGCQAA